MKHWHLCMQECQKKKYDRNCEDYAANIALAYMAGRRKYNRLYIANQLRFRQTNIAEQQNEQ